MQESGALSFLADASHVTYHGVMSEDERPSSHVRAFDLLAAADRQDYEDLINGESNLGEVRMKSQNDFPMGGESTAVMRIVDFTTKPEVKLPFSYVPPIC